MPIGARGPAALALLRLARLLELDGLDSARAAQAAIAPRLVIYPDETLRGLAGPFATEHLTTAVVLDRSHPTDIVGLVTVEQLLEAHLRDLVHERERKRSV